MLNKRLQCAELILASIVCATYSLFGAGNAAGQAATGTGDNPPLRRSFVYTITNEAESNQVAAYERNAETGGLVFLGTYPTGGRGTGRVVDSQSPLVVNEENTLLFATNPGSDDISVMAIREDGSLEAVGLPVQSRGVQPASLALRNNLLYVANKGDAANRPNYSGFRVGEDGALARIKRRINLNVGDNPTQVLFNSNGTMLIGIRFGPGALDTFLVKANGKLKPLTTLTGERGPFAGVFDPAAGDRLVVADARVPGAASYFLQDDGALSRVSRTSNAPERAACWIVMHSGGERAWVSNTGTNSISLFTVGVGGQLTLRGTHNTLAFGRTPFELALDQEDRFLYQLNVGSGAQSINVLRINEADTETGLEDVGAFALPQASSPIGLVVVTR
jgi:6-phosphogluconolactonase